MFKGPSFPSPNESSKLILPAPIGKPYLPSVYDDEFDSLSLNSNWVVSGSNTIYDLNTYPSYFTVTLGSLKFTSLNTRFFPFGSFSVTYRVINVFLSNYSNISLTFSTLVDSGAEFNGVVIGPQYVDGLKGVFATYDNGTYTNRTLTTIPTADAYYVKINYNALTSVWDFYYSLNGLIWIFVYTYTKAFSIQKVGFNFQGSQTDATLRTYSLDYIRWS
jgi:hypothetical protein